VTIAGGARVAYVIGELGKGGAEYQLYELVRGLDRRRFEPRVYVLQAGGYWVEPLRALGVEVVELPSAGSMDWRRLRALRRALASYRPHVLHTVLWSGNAYGRLAAVGLGIAVVVAAERNVVRRPGWQRVLERVLDAVTTRYLVNSSAIVDELALRGGLPRAKMEVIHNGIDLARLPPFDPERAGARAAAGFAPTRRLVAQVGRLEPQKDYPTFLSAAARIAAAVPDVDFVAIGEGTLRDALEAEAARLGIAARVRFTGLRHDVPAVLAGADLMVLASRHEGLPNVVIEAMATGAVPIVTDVGGARELVLPDETGVIVPIERPDAIAAAALALLASPERRRAMAVEGRRRIEERFTIDAMVRRTSAAYDELLAAAGVARAATSPA
jgi:glycosyltransferase involved in cell wall biosynthesis